MKFLRKNFLLIVAIIFFMMSKKLFANTQNQTDDIIDDNQPIPNDNEGPVGEPIPGYDYEEPNLPPWETSEPIVTVPNEPEPDPDNWWDGDEGLYWV